MAYATQADMINRFSTRRIIELTDDSGQGVIDSEILSAVLDSASAEVDMYLRAGGWNVPLSSPYPGWAKTATENIAIYLLYQRRARVPEEIKNEYNRTIERLKAIAKQEIKLREDDDQDISIDVVADDVMFKSKDLKGL